MKKIKDAEVLLKPIDRVTLDEAVPWLAELYRHAGFDPDHLTPEQYKALAEHLETTLLDPRSTLFSLYVDGTPGGVLGLLEQNPVERAASLMLLVRPALTGTGPPPPVGGHAVTRVPGTPAPLPVLRHRCKRRPGSAC